MTPDYRFNDYPLDVPGVRRYPDIDYEELVDVDYDDYLAWLSDYLAWLSDYLASLSGEPIPEQAEFCRKLTSSSPEVALRGLGSDLALDVQTRSDDSDCEVDEEKEEFQVWPHPSIPPADFGYRLAIALVLRPVAEAAERRRLLRLFFGTYNDYAMK